MWMRRWGIRVPDNYQQGRRGFFSVLSLTHDEGWWENVLKPLMVIACLAVSVFPLGACDHPAENCVSGQYYHGGCVTGPAEAAPETPVAVSPAPMSPVPASPAVVTPGVAPVAAGRGDPGEFAAADDRQCRSYGLTFGSHDYADCRIRLSAQHRGLDPNAR
jgi:hypothetical protein